MERSTISGGEISEVYDVLICGPPLVPLLALLRASGGAAGLVRDALIGRRSRCLRRAPPRRKNHTAVSPAPLVQGLLGARFGQTLFVLPFQVGSLEHLQKEVQ